MFLAKTSGWEVCFKEHDYCSAEQQLDSNSSSLDFEDKLSALIIAKRLEILQVCRKRKPLVIPSYPNYSLLKRFMRLNHAFDARTSELDAVRDRSYSVNLDDGRDNSINKRRRKSFNELTDKVYKEKIIDELEQTVDEAIENAIQEFCSNRNYSIEDRTLMTQMLNARRGVANQSKCSSTRIKQPEPSSAVVVTQRHRCLVVDSESDSDEEDDRIEEGYSCEFTCEQIREQYLRISKKYHTYSKTEKAQLVAFYELELEWTVLHSDASDTDKQLRQRARFQTCKHLKTIDGYHLITFRLVRAWVLQKAHAAELRKRGPRVDLDFQREVWNSILLVIYEKDATSGHTSLRIKANVAFTYEIIRHAAKAVQKKLCWRDDERIQKLQFSDTWVKGFLNRNKFNRKKITSEPKKVPSEAEVRRVMGERQSTYINMGMTRKQSGNMDETALLTAIGPSYCYVPTVFMRAEGDDICLHNMVKIVHYNP